MRKLFESLYQAPIEDAVNNIIISNPIFHDPNNWHPFDDNEGNFSTVENQQANPIAAVVEKLTNSIDALLMRKCYEAGIEPNSTEAPKSMEEAVRRFYSFENFDNPSYRRQIAEDIQILADPNSPKMNTSLIIYDNGEGQHPQEFPNTFLSFRRGNKNDIRFVQGKYNMGGTGAIIYCGENRYQLIGSRRFDATGAFGFTLIRMHPMTHDEELTKKNTYYEYFCPNGSIPQFHIEELDLNLHQRKFTTGTIIKLYSYDLPSGTRSVISSDLNQSINEFLHKPMLPAYIIDRKERYPKDKVLRGIMFGLSAKLQDNREKHVDREITLNITGNDEVGNIKVHATLFKLKSNDMPFKKFRESIQNAYFKNNIRIAFSLNGQVHGFYTSEFITKSLKWKLFKDYLLIHVDCTHLSLRYRNNLFMASRDRLKNGKEADHIRRLLADHLRKSELSDIYKQRKDFQSADTGDTNDLLKSFSKDLPLNPAMLKLLKQTFKLEEINNSKKGNKQKQPKPNKPPIKTEPFVSKRYPSVFTIEGKANNDGKVLKGIPFGGNKTIKFCTDVEDEYFDRIKDKGDLKLYILNHGPNDTKGGNAPGAPRDIEDVFQVVKSNPHDGTIRVNLQPKSNVQVGEEIEIRADLNTVEKPDEPFQVVFYVKIEQMKVKDPKPEEPEVPQIGLPEMILVYRDDKEGVTTWTWSKLEDKGLYMDDYEIMATLSNDKDELEKIFINMGSGLIKSYKSKLDGYDSLRIADNKYASQVYFHTLFLYSILKQKKYIFTQDGDNNVEKTFELDEVLQDLFKSSYGEFLLRFGGTEELIAAID